MQIGKRVWGRMQIGKGVRVYAGWGSGDVCRLGKEFVGCMKIWERGLGV